VLLCTGFLSYCGPFNQEFRTNLLNGWQINLSKGDIPFTEDLNITSMLVDIPTVRKLVIRVSACNEFEGSDTSFREFLPSKKIHNI
jgi:hypothetical protein